MNERMNVFMPYSEGRPIENNLSRGLAIVFAENQLVFDRFIDLLNSKLKEYFIAKPDRSDRIDIDIQQSAAELAGNFEGIRNIIPVTLTPEEAVEEEYHEGAEIPRTDISIVCGDNNFSDMVIIEVKRYGNSAHSQVIHQARKIIENGLNAEEKPAIKLKWQDIVQVLQNVQSLHEGRKDFVLDDYIAYLKKYCPEWFPVQPFQKNLASSLLWKRINLLADNCAKKLNIASEETPFSYRIKNSSWGYMRDVHFLDPCPEGISIAIWPGNTLAQSRFLFESDNINDNMSWILDKNIENFKMSVSSYFKFARRKQLGKIETDAESFGTDRKKIKADLFDTLAKRWYRDSWPELKQILSDKGLLSKYEGRNFEDSGMNFIDVSVGYCINININSDLLIKLDKNSQDITNPENDKIAALALRLIEKLRSKIEISN